MDFNWTPQQLAFKQSVIEFAQDNLNEGVRDMDREGLFPADKWRKCADFGLQGIYYDKAFGGQERDFLTSVLAMEAMGYGCRDNGLTFGLNAQIWTVQLPISRFATYDQKKRFLEPMCRGEMIGAHAISEPESGSDVYSMSMTATKTEGGYLLNGRKRYITFGPIADMALVFASTNPDVGKWGISGFLVDAKSDGYRSLPVQEKMGLRTVPIGELDFKDCFVPEENRLGKEGAGVSISNSSLEWERCCILASQLGAMERQLEEAIAYARERKQFGTTIGKFQSVSNRVVEMKLRLETARLLLYKVSWMKANDQPAMLESSLLKLYLSECFTESSLDAIRIHGGKGYLSEFEVERDLRDAIGGVIYGGTSDIQKNIVARLLGL
ncbi:MAG: acyl-CoA dehydrogenase family protein [Calditrichia bacterium]